jgi:hypothetical protein
MRGRPVTISIAVAATAASLGLAGPALAAAHTTAPAGWASQVMSASRATMTQTSFLSEG